MSKLSKVWGYLNKPVQEVAADIVDAAKGAALALAVGTAAVTAAVQPSTAMAQTAASYVTDAQTGITAAKADALTVGGYVIAAVAVLMAIGWVLSMLKRR